MNLVFEMFMWPYIYELNIEIFYFSTNIRFSFNIVTRIFGKNAGES